MTGRLKLKSDKLNQQRRDESSWWSKVPIVNDIVDSFMDKPRNATNVVNFDSEAAQDSEMPEDARYMNNIAALREKSQQKLNWNFFVGDSRFKLDFFLRFKAMTTTKTYERMIIGGSLYSIRLWLLMQALLLWNLQSTFLASQKASYETLQQSLGCQPTSPSADLPQDSQLVNDCKTGEALIAALTDGPSILSWLALLLQNAIFLLIGLAGTLLRTQSPESRKICMNLQSCLVQSYLIRLNHELMSLDQSSALFHVYILKTILVAPSFVTNMLIVGDWIMFLKIVSAQLILGVFWYSFKLSLGIETMHPGMTDFSSFSFLASLVMPVLYAAIIFSIFEKINKERFVINQTNQCTRKLFGELIDSCTPTVTVTDNGKITFFNKPFKSLVCEGLQFESLPSNIFQLFEEDPHNFQRLQQMLDDTYFSDAKSRKTDRVLEMRIMRIIQPEVNRLYRSKEEEKKGEEGKEMGDSVRKCTQEFSIGARKTNMKLFEMVKVTCQVSQFSAQKSLIVKLERVTDYQGHAQLIVQQAYLLQTFITSFLCLVEEQMMQDQRNRASPALFVNNEPNRQVNGIGFQNQYGRGQQQQQQQSFPGQQYDKMVLFEESLQNPQFLVSCLSQIQFQVKLMSIMSVTQTMCNARKNSKKIEVDFLFAQSIIHAIQQCTSLTEAYPEIKYVNSPNIDALIKGDVDILKLAIQALTEFSLKYGSQDSQVFIHSTFSGKIDVHSYMVSIQLIMKVNSKYDTNKVMSLLRSKEFFKGEAEDSLCEIQNLFTKRSIMFGEYFSEFGVGLLLLPILSHLLDAEVLAKLGKFNGCSGMIPKRTTGGSSVISGKSAISSQDVDQSLIVTFKVPLCQPDRPDLASKHLPPTLIPEELSNRRTEGQVTYWRNQEFIRAEIQREKAMAEACAEHMEQNIMASAAARTPVLEPRAFSNMNYKTVYQTPQTQVRTLNQEMQNNQIMCVAPLSEDGGQEGHNSQRNEFNLDIAFSQNIDQQVNKLANRRGGGEMGQNSRQAQAQAQQHKIPMQEMATRQQPNSGQKHQQVQLQQPKPEPEQPDSSSIPKNRLSEASNKESNGFQVPNSVSIMNIPAPSSQLSRQLFAQDRLSNSDCFDNQDSFNRISPENSNRDLHSDGDANGNEQSSSLGINQRKEVSGAQRRQSAAFFQGESVGQFGNQPIEPQFELRQLSKDEQELSRGLEAADAAQNLQLSSVGSNQVQPHLDVVPPQVSEPVNMIVDASPNVEEAAAASGGLSPQQAIRRSSTPANFPSLNQLNQEGDQQRQQQINLAAQMQSPDASQQDDDEQGCRRQNSPPVVPQQQLNNMVDVAAPQPRNSNQQLLIGDGDQRAASSADQQPVQQVMAQANNNENIKPVQMIITTEEEGVKEKRKEMGGLLPPPIRKESENIESYVLDEIVAGENSKALKAKAEGFISLEIGSSSEEEDEGESKLTEEQIKAMKIKKKEFFDAYKARLKEMRAQEKAKNQQIIIQKGLENHSDNVLNQKEKLPLIQLRHDDHLGEDNSEKLGGSRSIILNSNVSRVELRQNNPPLISPQSQQEKKTLTKLDIEKITQGQKVREVQRRIMEQSARIMTKKGNHEVVKNQLTEVDEAEVLKLQTDSNEDQIVEENKDDDQERVPPPVIMEAVKEITFFAGDVQNQPPPQQIVPMPMMVVMPMMPIEEEKKQPYAFEINLHSSKPLQSEDGSMNLRSAKRADYDEVVKEEQKRNLARRAPEYSLSFNLQDDSMMQLDNQDVDSVSNSSPSVSAKKKYFQFSDQSESPKKGHMLNKQASLKALMDIDKIDVNNMDLSFDLKNSIGDLQHQLAKLRLHKSMSQISLRKDQPIMMMRPMAKDEQSEEKKHLRKSVKKSNSINKLIIDESISDTSSVSDESTPIQRLKEEDKGSLEFQQQNSSEVSNSNNVSIGDRGGAVGSPKNENFESAVQDKQNSLLMSLQSGDPSVIEEESSQLSSKQFSRSSSSRISLNKKLSSSFEDKRDTIPKKDLSLEFNRISFQRDFKSSIVEPIALQQQPNCNESQDNHWERKLQEGFSTRRQKNVMKKLRNRGVLGNLSRKVIGPEGFFAMKTLLTAEKKLIEQQGGIVWNKRMIKSCHKRVDPGSDEDEVQPPKYKIKTEKLCEYDEITDRSSINSEHSFKKIIVGDLDSIEDNDGPDKTENHGEEQKGEEKKESVHSSSLEGGADGKVESQTIDAKLPFSIQSIASHRDAKGKESGVVTAKAKEIKKFPCDYSPEEQEKAVSKAELPPEKAGAAVQARVDCSESEQPKVDDKNEVEVVEEGKEKDVKQPSAQEAPEVVEVEDNKPKGPVEESKD